MLFLILIMTKNICEYICMFIILLTQRPGNTITHSEVMKLSIYKDCNEKESPICSSNSSVSKFLSSHGTGNLP